MQAIILAAGMGRRLGELTKNNTKCMIEVNGISLIDRLLTQLSHLKLNKIIIVTGYESEKLRLHIGEEYLGLKIQYIENPIFYCTNNIYSLSLAKNELQEDDTLLIESDLIFDDSIFKELVEDAYPNLALVDKYEPWMDGTMVCLDEENNIINFISKRNFDYGNVSSYYKTVNIYKFSREFAQNSYVPFLEAYTKTLGNNEYYEQVLRVITLLDRCNLKAKVLSGQKWYEIDDVQDLDIAETLFANNDKKVSLYQRRFGGYWRFPSLLDFCYLVNPYFPPIRMREELKANFDNLLTEYPSGMEVNNLLVSKYFKVSKELVCVGNGAAELIKALMDFSSGNIGVIYPTFEEYPNRCETKRIISYIPNSLDFTYSVHDIISYFEKENISSLILINPDNPSGNFISKDNILYLLKWAEYNNIRLIIDESFVDFSSDMDSSLIHDDILYQYPNLVVVKSISKSYGVPGLRLGVVVSSCREIIDYLKRSLSIWNINSFAEFYLQIFGKYESEYNVARVKFIKERERFYKELCEIDFLRVIPSEANYFLCEVIKQYTSEMLVHILLDKYNILVKNCSCKKAFDNRNYIRIAVRNTIDNNKFLMALKQL